MAGLEGNGNADVSTSLSLGCTRDISPRQGRKAPRFRVFPRSNQRPFSGTSALTRPSDALGAPSPRLLAWRGEIRYSLQRILKPFIIMHRQLRFNLFDNFNNHRHHNQQAGAAKG